MKQKRWGMPLWIAVIILVQVIRMFYWENQKDGFFIDEFFTYENVVMAPTELGMYSTGFRWQSPENFLNNYHTSEEFRQHFNFTAEDSLLTLSVPKLLKKFMSIKPYYFVLNLWMSMHPGGLSKWYAFSLNILLFILMQIVMYTVSKELLQGEKLALLPMLAFGFCGGAVSMVVYIRFYILYALCTLFVTYCHIHLLKGIGKTWSSMLGILAATFIGYKNAEYTLIFVFFMALSYVVIQLIRKQWKQVLIYVGTFLVGGIGYICYKPGVLYTFTEGQGLTAAENLKGRGISEQMGYLRYYYQSIQSCVWGSKLIMLLLVLAGVASIILTYRALKKQQKAIGTEMKTKLSEQKMNVICTVMIIVTIVGYLLLVTRITPFVTWRYNASLIALIMIVILVVFTWMTQWFKKQQLILTIGTAVFVCFMLISGDRYINELHEGVVPEQKTFLQENCDGADSLFIYPDIDILERDDADHFEKEFYYCSYLWPEGTKAYVTELDELMNNTEYTCDQEVLVWVRTEEDWNTYGQSILDRLQLSNSEFLMDAGDGIYQVYRCTK